MPTRREFLQGAFWTAAGAYLAYTGADKLGVIDRVYPRTPEAQNLPPDFIAGYIILVNAGVNFRTSPQIPSRTRISHPSNSISFNEIEEVNGVPLGDMKAFIIKNPPMVEGHDVDGERDHNYWIKMDVKRKGDNKVQPYYVSGAYVTRNEVKLMELSHTEGLELQPNGSYIDSDGIVFSAAEIGRVYVPQDESTIAREIMPTIWSTKAWAKLDGTTPLRPDRKIEVLNAKPTDEPRISRGERILDQVTIGISQINARERAEMEQAGTPINVRNYPNTEYYNGEPVELVGKIAVGTKINNVLTGMTDGGGFVAFRLRDVQGDLVEVNRNSLHPVNIDTICAIHWAYIE